MKNKKLRHLMTPDSELAPEALAKRKKRQMTVRIISIIVLLLAAAGVTYMLHPLFEGFGKEGWTDQMRDRIDRYGTVSGVFIFLAIQALQVPIALVPAIQVVGGVLYGWFFGSLLSYLGIVLGTIAVWGLGSWIGTPIVEAFFSSKDLSKFSFLDDENKLIIILIILEIMPGIPKDLLAYVVPLTKLKMRSFFLYVLPFRIPAIMLSTAFGNSITKGNYAVAITISAAMFIIAIVGFLMRDKLLEKLGGRKAKASKNSIK